MADIRNWLDKIKSAIYGREVREALHNSIEAINDELVDTIGRVGDVEDDVSSLRQSLDDEINDRTNADTKLGDKIEKERQFSIELDTRLKDVEEIAHDHDNKDLLDGITAEDIELWNDGGRNKLNATLATPEMIDEMMKNATPDVTVPDGITIGLATREQVEKIFDE